MFDKQFLQSVAAGLSRGLSLFWSDPEPFAQPMSEEEIIRREARRAACARRVAQEITSRTLREQALRTGDGGNAGLDET